MNIKSLGISLAVVTALSFSFTGCGEEDSEELASSQPSLSKSYMKLFGTEARDYANDSAYDSSNNLYVVGQTKGDFETAQNSDTFDMFLRKLDSNGETLCKFQYGTDHDDVASNVVVDSQNNVYVTGWTHRDFDGHTYAGGSIYKDGGDIFVMKFNSSCEKQSSILFGTTESEAPEGMSIDSDDNIYITGWTNSEINNQVSQGGLDFFITKLNTDLTEIWTTQDGSDGNDWSKDIAVDTQGYLYVVGGLDNDIVGETSVLGGEDGFIAKYNTGDGSRVWARSFGSTNDSSGTDQATSVAVTSSGDAVVGFTFSGSQNSGIAYFKADGTKLWQKATEGYANIPVAVGKDDVIYSGNGDYGYKKTLRKFTKDGEQIWYETLDPAGNAYTWHSSLTYNPNDGHVYVVGATEGNFDEPNDSEDEHKGTYDAYVMKFK